MLTNIHIKNFRTCADVQIENMGSIVALVGRNGAGKSNILQAIGNVAKMASSSDAVNFVEFISERKPNSIDIEFNINSIAYRYKLGIGIPTERTPVHLVEHLSRADGGIWNPIVSRTAGTVSSPARSQPLSIGESSPALSAILTLLPESDELAAAVKPVRQFLANVHYYPLDEPASEGKKSTPISHSDYASWLASYKASGSIGESVVMRILHMFNTKKDDFETLKSLLGSNGLDLVDDIHVFPMRRIPPGGDGNSDEYYFVDFSPSLGVNERTSLGYSYLSLGTRRVIRALTSMLFDNSSVMLIEQLEDGLHQGLITKLVGLLRQNAHPTQLVFSSHSSALLNTLTPDAIRLVSLQDGFTTVRALSAQEIKVADKFMNEEGALYEFLDTVQEE